MYVGFNFFHSLLLCGLFYDATYFMSSLCYFVLVFFSPFSIAITSLGEERASLGAFRMFVRFALVWLCLFPLPLGVWEGLRCVIVVLPGLFSYPFLSTKTFLILKSLIPAAPVNSLFYLYFQRKSWHFMWIVSRADDSHEVQSIIVSQKH